MFFHGAVSMLFWVFLSIWAVNVGLVVHLFRNGKRQSCPVIEKIMDTLGMLLTNRKQELNTALVLIYIWGQRIYSCGLNVLQRRSGAE